MATIYHSFSSLANTGNFDEMELHVNNYWGTTIQEKIFPIPFWKIMQMFNASPSEQVALHVTDMDNRALVDAEWVVYNEAFEAQLAAATLPQEYYFVLHESRFQEIRSNIPGLENPINSLMIWGRLGNATVNGTDFSAFLVATIGQVIDLTGGGGDGASTGFKIPPGQ